MKVSTGAALAPLLMAASAYAQLYTTTYPWAVRISHRRPFVVDADRVAVSGTRTASWLRPQCVLGPGPGGGSARWWSFNSG